MKSSSAVKIFLALGHEARLTICCMLATKGDEGMQAGEIASLLDMPGATLSFHLAQLSAAKVISSEKQGRNITYFIKTKRFKKLISFVEENCIIKSI